MTNLFNLWKAIILSMLPVSEVRGGIPLAFYYNLQAYIILLVISNILVIPIVYFFLDKIHEHLLRFEIYKRWYNKKIKKVQRKFKPMLDKYGYVSLFFFVGLPLPFTGAYTGTLAAWLFGLNRKKATFFIILGVLLASLITTLVVVAGVGAFSFFIKKLY
jgi:uncharacterized membrane protein